jgi:membrane protease subunit HflC
MKNIGTSIAAVIALAIFILVTSAFYIVDEKSQAVVTLFGEPVAVVLGSLSPELRADFEKDIAAYESEKGTSITIKQGAGLYTKIPFLHKIIILEDRILEYDSEPTDIVTRDKKHLLVDNFARWRIVNPLRFIQTVRTENGAQARLDDIIYSILREDLAKSNLVEIVRTENTPALKDHITTGREVIMNAVTAKANVATERYGIQVIDVRIKRADLPRENLAAVFSRMKAERSRISKQYRSEGEEEAAKIRAETDRDVKIILAEAYKKAEEIKGRGDAEAAAVYAKAYGSHEEFYTFLESLEVIKRATGPQDQLIISTSSGIYKYLK